MGILLMDDRAHEWTYGNPLVQQEIEEETAPEGNRKFLLVVFAAVVAAIVSAVLLSAI
jgi:hypothetical protein